MNYLPTLYKSTKSEACQSWLIGFGSDEKGSFYEVEFGQLDGVMQLKRNYVLGKNIGKANETTPLQQAEKEAKSRWLSQTDKNYSTSVACETVNILPMLAHKYLDHVNKVKYPCFVQPKLDGCISGGTILDTKEYGGLKISEVVNKRIRCNVKSFNVDSGNFEYKKVKAYFLNRELPQSPQWYEITVESGEKLQLTGNHLVFLPDLKCWRRVDDLDGTENLMIY